MNALTEARINRRSLALMAGMAPLVGVPSVARAQEPRPLRVRMSADISQLDPILIFDPSSHYVAGSIYSRLVRYRPGTTEIQPDLASDWEVSDDGMTYTFHLREDVQWHKGYGQVTANDVKFSVERHLNPENASLFAAYFDVMESVEAVDDFTVRFRLRQPFAPFVGSTLAFRSGWIVSQQAIEDAGEDYLQNPIGSGPYVFESWAPGQNVTLLANEEYFEGAPEIQQLVFVPIPEDSAAELAMLSGEIDLSYFNLVEVFQRLESSGEFVAESPIGLGVHGMMINLTRPPFDDLLVRQAMAHAIDQEGIVATVWQGLAEVPTGFLTPQYLGYTDDVQTYPYDPERAMELLAEAGHGEGFETSLLYASSPPWPQMAPIIQANFQQVGIQLELQQLEFAAYQVPRREGNYDLIAISTSRPADPDLILTEYFHSRSFPPGVNNSYYDQIDELIEEARLEQDTEAREAIYAQIQQRMAEDIPGLWVDWNPILMVHNPDIVGHAIVMNYDLNPQTMRFAE